MRYRDVSTSRSAGKSVPAQRSDPGRPNFPVMFSSIVQPGLFECEVTYGAISSTLGSGLAVHGPGNTRCNQPPPGRRPTTRRVV